MTEYFLDQCQWAYSLVPNEGYWKIYYELEKLDI